MPFTTATVARLSDLVVHEFDPSVGYSRRDINITEDTEAVLGTVVFRAATADLAAPYAPVTTAGQLVDSNEFAVVFGDEFSFNPSFTARAIVAGQYNAVGFVGTSGALQLKEQLIKQYIVDDAELSEANFETLKGLLEAQGIQILKTV